jgi:hypothetical protein
MVAGVISCQKENTQSTSDQQVATQIFTQLSPERSGVDFTNYLIEDSVVNYFTYPYIYMGGGVAVGDVNNDGLQDLYFTGNQVENKLYLNQGDLTFKDITDHAGVAGDNRWVTGVTMADVNHDGLMDIYVSVSGKWTTTNNLLYLNQGVDESGTPSFIESAEQAGIADDGHSTQATFFDYDKDGDLDLYVANYPYTSFKTMNSSYRFMMERKQEEKSDRFYQNQGNGTFEDVTKKANLLNFGLSLGVIVDDFNQDGWEDIYVSNDFATPDYFYFNNGDGTFSEKIKETTAHTAYFGMGIDAGDLNNDGLPDLVQMDMTPGDNRRNKANMASMNPSIFYEMINLGMHFQYMQNSVQLNQGITDSGHPHFSDMARITGMSATDWSWAGLIVDLDNDGWKDVFITNGTRKDINNKDYFAPIDKASNKERQGFDLLELSKNIPHEEIDNYAFRNNGDLSFANVTESWGLSFKGFSNGAAYADLDNDGDLEVIINNIDHHAIVFENHTSDKQLGNYLRIQLSGQEKNPQGLGTRILLNTAEGIQYHHHTLTRGFQSSVEPTIHFGVGAVESIEEIEVTWPDGKQQVLNNIDVNQVLEINYLNASRSGQPQKGLGPRIFKEVTSELDINYRHQENVFNDFQYEVLLPHIYSRNGPGLAVGDVNSDGLDDFYVGGASGSSGELFLQQPDGSFQENHGDNPWYLDSLNEDMGALLFDADQDGDLDLYVVSGGNEFLEGSRELQDRLYLNQGDESFVKSNDALPEMYSSGSRVKAADYDGDGDMDLFVGGRLVPRSYPKPAKSYILRNDGLQNGTPKFIDVTEVIAPDLMQAGMVTDGVWTDFDQDGQKDLVVVGEWMPLTFLKNHNGTFENKTQEYGLSKTTGWWYSILAEDFDDDGDTDFVAGNLGLNYKYQATIDESFDVFAYDYDKNGNMDIVLGYYNAGTQYPLRGRQCSSQQIPAISIKFEDYNSFAEATLEEVYSEGDLSASLHYQAHTFASSYIENHGDQSFSVQKLPNEVQLSSINGIVAGDFNQDQHLDMVVAGNLYNAEVETTRNDAGYGYLLYGDGQGNFKPVPYRESGIYIPFDTKDLKQLKGKNGTLIIAANNSDALTIFQLKPQSSRNILGQN